MSLLRTLKQHLLTIIVKYSYNNTVVAGDFQSIIFSQISDRQKFLHENLTFFAKFRIDRNLCDRKTFGGTWFFWGHGDDDFGFGDVPGLFGVGQFFEIVVFHQLTQLMTSTVKQRLDFTE